MTTDADTDTAGQAQTPPQPAPEPSRLNPPKCPYCGYHAYGWLATEAQDGRRMKGGTMIYHCYAAYCLR